MSATRRPGTGSRLAGLAAAASLALGAWPRGTDVNAQGMPDVPGPFLALTAEEIAGQPAAPPPAPGADPRLWREAARAGGRHPEAFPGADLMLRGDAGQIEALWWLAPGADPSGLELTIPDATAFETSGSGHAIVRAPGGDVVLLRPGLHQEGASGRRAVRGGWEDRRQGRVGLRVAELDPAEPLAAGFRVLLLPEAAPLLDRNRDGRVTLDELPPAAAAALGGPLVTATKRDTLVVDNDSDGQADPGDTLRYDVVIGNTGTDATAVQLADPLDPNLTLVPGSLNVSPLALDDNYEAIGHVTLTVANPLQGLFANDTEFLGDTFTLTSPAPGMPTPTAGGGTVTVQADGTFTYSSPPGSSATSDSFTYTITDGGGLTGAATVTFDIAGLVWFVDRDAAPGGTGTQASPFDELADVNGAGGAGDPDAPNHVIYLHDRAAVTDYVNGLELEAGQRLVGSGVPLVVGTTTVLPATTPPTIEHTGGDVVRLANGARVEGLHILAANDAAIAGTGPLGTVDVASVTVTTSGAGGGVRLTNHTGTVNLGASIGGTGSAAGALVDGGDGTLDMTAGSVTKTAGRLVEVRNRTGGAVTFGSVAGTGAATDAVVLQANAGGTVTFANGLSVVTSAARGLFASGGGTVNVAGSGSTIDATGGAALDVAGTSFGAGAVFASVSSTNSAAEGIRLANVSGPVTIDGGAISGSTGTAFSLSQGSAAVAYAGAISKTSAGRAVDVQSRAGGAVTFSGAITATGASTGINVSGATAASTVAFTGPVDLGAAGTPLTGGTALTVNHNGNASTTSFADLDVVTTGQEGIGASNGGTFSVAVGSVDAGRRALNLDGLALGATFTSVASTGSTAEGVRLNAVTGSMTINSTAVTNPGTQGIAVQGSSATVDFGGTSVSGGGTQRILVATSTGDLDFGNAVLAGGTDGVSLQNNSGGTRTFGTLSIGGNSGIGFLHAGGGGSVNVTGATTITNPGGTGVDIQGVAAGTGVTFNGVTVNKGASAGTGVALGSNLTAPSFGVLSITTSNGPGLAITSSGVSATGGSIASTNGPAISAATAGFAATFGSVSSTNSATQGISLSGATGTLVMNGGTLSGSAGTAFAVTGGNAVVTHAGTVSVTNGQSGLVASNVAGGSLALGTVNVSGTGAGRDAVVIDGTGVAYDVTVGSATLDTSAMRHGVALSDLGAGSDITFTGGTITSTGAGRRVVSFAGPTNGVFNFSGVTLSAAGSQGLSFGATQAGTYSFRDLDCGTPDGGVCLAGSGNGAGVTLRAVSQTGGTLGVSLANTTGSFTVTGNGGACSPATPTCTGGTISGTSGADGATAGAGVWLQNASNVSLTRMRVQNHPNFAIRGQNVTGFTLDTSVVDGANGNSVPSREGSVVIDGLFGAAAVTHSTISGGIEDNLRIENTTATALTSLNVSGTGGTGSTCRFLNNSTVSGNIGFRLAGFNSAAMTVTVSGCLFQGNRTDAVNIDAANTAVVTSTVTNNVLIAGTGGANQGNLGINVTAAATATHRYTVANNQVGTDGVTPAPLINTGINLFSGNGSTLGSATVGSVSGNTVRNAGTGSGHGIQVFQDLTSTLRTNVDGNTVSNVALDFGLRVEASGDPAGAGGSLQAGVTNNNVSVLASALDSLRVRSRRQAVFCSDIRANTTNAGGTAGGFFGLFANQSNTSTFSIEGMALGPQSPATAQAFLIGQNPAAATVSATGTTYNGVAVNACTIP